uniref:DUF38 domain-containing protein n=1 Tax=Panagrolaimus davidi TaxID=227884 RepID=A0A914Q411_9BILA
MSTIINNGNKKYTFVLPRKQCFSFPPDVISSMLKQPSSPNGLWKLYQTCKYFYSKKQILIISDTQFDRHSFYYGKENPKLKIKSSWGRENYADFQHLLWHTGKLKILHYFQSENDRHLYFEKNRIPKFYRCSIKNLELYETVLSLDDFKLVTAEKQIEKLFIQSNSWIYYQDYSKVDIAEILRLELMPKLYSLRCFPHATNYTNKVIEKFSLLQLQTKLSCLSLDFSECPNFNNDVNKDYLLKFLENNAKKNENFFIILTSRSNKELKSDLEKIVQKWKNEITL